MDAIESKILYQASELSAGRLIRLIGKLKYRLRMRGVKWLKAALIAQTNDPIMLKQISCIRDIKVLDEYDNHTYPQVVTIGFDGDYCVFLIERDPWQITISENQIQLDETKWISCLMHPKDNKPVLARALDFIQ